MVAPLPAGYYLDNFSLVLSHVREHDQCLLGDVEKAFLDEFYLLSRDAQRLYVRLYSRKGPLFRQDKLKYPEISDLDAAADEAIAGGFLDSAPDADNEALMSLLVKGDLVSLGDGAISANRPREEIVQALLLQLEPGTLRDTLTFRILRPLHTDVIDVFRLLFFGNLDQDFREFVLHELDITPFEDYPIDHSHRYFQSREHVEQARQLYAARQVYADSAGERDAGSLVDLADTIPPVSTPALARRAGRVVGRIARQLERLGEQDAALALYRRTTVAPSRERQVRILASMERSAEALDLCWHMAAEPEDEAEFEFAASFANRLARRIEASLVGIPSPPRALISQSTIRVPQLADCRVEALAAAWFREKGSEAWYVENSLLPGIFGLAFWDIIFYPMPGAFLNRFQRGPLDLFTPEFRRNRRELIESRFDEISDSSRLRQRVLSTFESRYPRANFFVHWGALSASQLDFALDRIPVAELIAVFRRLLRDPKNNRSGFPDLAVFPSDGGYQLVEVKGPGDTLQQNQRRWLRYFGEVGITANVLSVEWM